MQYALLHHSSSTVRNINYNKVTMLQCCYQPEPLGASKRTSDQYADIMSTSRNLLSVGRFTQNVPYSKVIIWDTQRHIDSEECSNDGGCLLSNSVHNLRRREEKKEVRRVSTWVFMMHCAGTWRQSRRGLQQDGMISGGCCREAAVGRK